ncbi:MAG: hypothetical protein ACR2N9_04985, partial [Acidimicrobiia bacterium]
VRESLWSTDAVPEEQVVEEVMDPPPPPQAAPQTASPEPPAAGPFSASAPTAAPVDVGQQGSPFAAQSRATPVAPAATPDSGPFGTTGTDDPVPTAPLGHEAPRQEPRGPEAGAQEQPTHRPTPDEHGLSVSVESLSAKDRERCDTPIAVCGALLGEQEVVLGLAAGHLLGHPAVVALTNTRVLVANARRWKPLVDQFIPDAELMVHLRHDRDIASITFVQGQRLTGVDDITDVTAAVDLVERIRAAAARAS